MIIKIKEIDFAKIHHDAVFVLVGKRRTGKTTWGKVIISALNGKIGRFCLIAGNKDVRYEWSDSISSLYVTPKAFGEAKLEELRNYQENRVCMYTKKNEPIPYKYRVCVILDDCGSDIKFMKSNIIRDILANGRHYGMFTLIMVQYYYQIPRRCRENIDYLGLLRTNNKDNLRKIHTELVGHTTARAFRFCSAALTGDFGLLFIDNTTPTAVKVSDSVFYKNSDPRQNRKRTEHELVTQYGLAHSRNHTTTTPEQKKQIQVPSQENHTDTYKYEFKDRTGSVLIIKQPLPNRPEEEFEELEELEEPKESEESE